MDSDAGGAEMSNTQRTDALSLVKHTGGKVFQDTRIWKLARQLERELTGAQAQIKLATDFIINFSGNILGGGDQPVQFLCSSFALVVNQNKALKAQIAELERTLAAQRTALLYCYEKLQPMQPFEEWVKEIEEIIK